MCCSFVALTHTAGCPAFGLSNNHCPGRCAPLPAVRTPSAPGSHPYPHSAPEVTSAISEKGRARHDDSAHHRVVRAKPRPNTHNAHPHPLPLCAPLRRRARTRFPIPHQRLRARSAERGALDTTTAPTTGLSGQNPAHPLTTHTRTRSRRAHPFPPCAPLRRRARTRSPIPHQRLRARSAKRGALDTTTAPTTGLSGHNPAHPLTTRTRTRSRCAHPFGAGIAPVPPFRTRGYGRDQRKGARGSAPWPEIIATLFPGITSHKPRSGPESRGPTGSADPGRA